MGGNPIFCFKIETFEKHRNIKKLNHGRFYEKGYK